MWLKFCDKIIFVTIIVAIIAVWRFYFYATDCTDGDMRIIPYSSYSNSVGRVEVCSDGAWGGICNDFFDHSDAQVICRQLGYYAIGK